MEKDWYARLIKAIENDGSSLRSLSLKAGLSDTYIHHMVKYEKQPTVDKFIAICSAINKDPAEIITGVKSSPELAKAIQMFAAMPPDQRKAFLAMLETVQPGTQPSPEKSDPAPAD